MAKRVKRRARRRRREEHGVTFCVPDRPIPYSDIVFTVRLGLQKVGELRVSQGGLDWYPRSAKKARSMTWEQLERALSRRRKRRVRRT